MERPAATHSGPRLSPDIHDDHHLGGVAGKDGRGEPGERVGGHRLRRGRQGGGGDVAGV